MEVMVSLSKKHRRKKKKQKSPEMQRRSDMLKVMMPMLSDEDGIKLAKAIENSDGSAAFEALQHMGHTLKGRLDKEKK
jgi:hypothetical protein